MPTPPLKSSNVALLVTCLVDLMRPRVGFAAVTLLERAGCRVSVPEGQTCCGQPAYNSGDRKTAQKIAKQVIETFEGYDYVVVPSGSCAGMLRVHYERLLGDDPAADSAQWAARARALAQRTYELTQFLTEVMGLADIAPPLPGRAAYHDSCSGLRELGIKDQPRRLLGEVQDYSGSETCCGFGGTFCVKFPEISDRIVGQRVGELAETESTYLLGGDLGCLLNLAGKLRREGSQVRVFHVAEALAGLDGPAIGEAP